MRRLQVWFFGCLCLALTVCLPTIAQAKLDEGQLDQLLAPVALYPDSLLSQVLMGATYPDDIAVAAQWSATHTDLSGDAAVKAVELESWDPSVKSLVAFPSVMDLMGRQPAWVKSVGDAFLAQPDTVMDSVQRLRAQARQAGNLKSTPQQKVTSSDTGGGKTVVVIEPADPQVIYVPSYNPTVVYGTWPYPAQPPAYYPPPPGSVFATSLVAGIGFGLGVAAVDSVWGGFNWGHHDVNINVNRYNNINVNQRISATSVNSNHAAWHHNPANRGNAPYADSASRQRFDGQRQAGLQNRGQGRLPPVPGSRDAARDRAAQSFQGRTGQPLTGHVEPRGGSHLGQGGDGNRTPNGRPEPSTDRHTPATDRRSPSTDRRTTSADREAAVQRQHADAAAARDRSRANNDHNALRDAGNGDHMREQAQRGERAASAPRGGEGGHTGRGGRTGDGGHLTRGDHFGGRR
ncbi:MAG: DUF3300 domain-containing protein [Achromobacter sp.]